MSDTRSNTRHLVNVSEREVEAMHSDVLGYDARLGYAPPIDLAGLVSDVYRLTQDDDVREHAAIIVASLLPGASSPLHAARAAVGIARRAVDASHALDRWDMFGDLTEEVVTDWQAMGVASHLTRYAPDPATAYAPTYGDLVATILAGQRTGVGDQLRAACVAYVDHARTCNDCTGADSHRVTLAGVRAHMDGRGATDATYHSERRAVLRALARVGTFTDLARTIGDPAPLTTPHPARGRVNLGSIRKDSTRDQAAPVRTVHTSAERVVTERVALVTRTVAGTHTRENSRAWRHACRDLDRAQREARLAWERVTGRRAAARGTVGEHDRTTASWHLLDVNGYRLAYGYGDPSAEACAVREAERAVTEAERAAVTRTPDRTVSSASLVTTTTTEHGTPRAMQEREHDALRATVERAARHAGEEYRGGTHAPVSAQADAFAYAPRAEANTGKATTPGQALPSGAVPVSPRKRARTGSTGPTVTAF